MDAVTATVIDVQIEDQDLAHRPEPCIEGAQVLLTPLQRDNFHTLLRWNNDEALHRLASEVPFVHESYGSFKKRFDHSASNLCLDACEYEIHIPDGSLIGEAFIDRIHYFDQRCRVGLTICDQAYRGMRYGRATLELLLRHLFCDCGFHCVEAETYEFHEAWPNLLVSVGFRPVRCWASYLLRDGKHWDKTILALLRSEYDEHQRCP